MCVCIIVHSGLFFMLHAVWNKSWTIQIRQTRHARLDYQSKDELLNDVLRWTPTHRRPVLVNVQGLTCNSSVRTLDAIYRTYREQWMIETDSERVRELRAIIMD